MALYSWLGRKSNIAGRLLGCLAREQIRDLPHRGVVFRPLAVPAKAKFWIAWHRDNHAKALHQFVDVIKKEAPGWE